MSDEPAPRRHAAVIRTASGKIDPGLADIAFLGLVAQGYKDSRGLTVAFHSDPGTGKTALMQAAAIAAGLKPFVIDMTRRAPEDVTGIPRPQEVAVPVLDRAGNPVRNEDGSPMLQRAWFTIKTPDVTWATIAATPNAAIIFDDGTNIAPAVQAAMLDIVLDKRYSDGVGGYISLEHAAVFIAANYGDGSALSPFLAPFANRVTHVVATRRDNTDYYRWIDSFDLEEHPERLTEALDANLLTVDPSRAATLAANQPRLFAKYLARVARYITETNGGALTSPTPQDFPTPESYAFATNRTFELAARWLAVAEHFDVDPTRLVYGAVGKDKGKDFLSWMRVRELVTATLRGTVEWQGMQPSEQGTVARRAAEVAQGDEQLRGLLTSLDRLQELTDGSEDVFVPARDALIRRARGELAPPLTRGQQFQVRSRWRERYAEIERAALDKGLDTAGRNARAQRERVDEALGGRIDWKALSPADQRRVAVEAAASVRTDAELDGMLTSLRRLVTGGEAARPAYDAARNLLIERGLGRAPALSGDQDFKVRSEWPRVYRQIAGAADDVASPGVA